MEEKWKDDINRDTNNNGMSSEERIPSSNEENLDFINNNNQAVSSTEINFIMVENENENNQDNNSSIYEASDHRREEAPFENSHSEKNFYENGFLINQEGNPVPPEQENFISSPKSRKDFTNATTENRDSVNAASMNNSSNNQKNQNNQGDYNANRSQTGQERYYQNPYQGTDQGNSNREQAQINGSGYHTSGQNYGGDPGVSSGQYINSHNAQNHSSFSQTQRTYGYGNGSAYYDKNGILRYKTTENNRKQKKKHPKLKKVLIYIGSAIFLGLIMSAGFQTINLTKKILGVNESTNTSVNLNQNKNNSLAATVVSNTSPKTISDVSAIVDSVMPSIVSITSTTTATSYNFFGSFNRDVEGSGSGIIIGKTNTELLIVTNNHVIQNAKAIQITFVDGNMASAVVKGKDPTADLAVVAIPLKELKEETKKKIKVASLGNSDELKVGQMVLAIGNALGYGQSLTVGYVSAKDREVNVDGKQMILLQTDAAINPGNSGGALINMNGEVVGINSVKFASQEVEGMGYAIPMARALPIIDELKTREILSEEEQGFLGIHMDNVTEEENNIYNMPIGVYIKGFVEGSAAQTAGVLKGDIIVKVNNTTIENKEQLKEVISSYRADTVVTLTIMRFNKGEYEEKEIKVKLGKNTAINQTEQNSQQEDREVEESPDNYENPWEDYNDIEDFFRDFLMP